MKNLRCLGGIGDEQTEGVVEREEEEDISCVCLQIGFKSVVINAGD